MYVSVARLGNETRTDQNAIFTQEQGYRLHGFHRHFQAHPQVYERRIVVAQT